MTRPRLLACTLMLIAMSAGIATSGPRSLASIIGIVSAEGRADAAARRVTPRLQRELDAASLSWGAPMLVRIFKLESELELWVDDGQRYRLFRTYPICRYSGVLGPKQREGDLQAPEGFYSIGRGQLNPFSRYHLSFDLGYPNAFDRAHGRTGSLLMVHGSCVSIGCYAMGDAAIEEIYTLLEASLDAGQAAVPVHAFPFRFDRVDLDAHLADPTWGEFWARMRAAWDAFERQRIPPRIRVAGLQYVITDASR